MESSRNTVELTRIVEVGTQAALMAGAFLMESFGNIRTIERKPDKSLVTNVDKEAEAIIVDCIMRHFPDHRIFAEERGHEGEGSGCTWIIDPLDGTHNFIRGIPIFGTSIGVVCGDAFVAGIIYMPYDENLYTAKKGGGAFKNEIPIHVSTTSAIEECSLSYDSTFRDGSQQRIKVLDHLGRKVFNIRMMGCSTRVMTYIADGTFDGAVEFDDRPWDFAAGVTLVQEAGGVVTGFDGKELTMDNSGYVVANPALHGKLLAEVRSMMESVS